MIPLMYYLLLALLLFSIGLATVLVRKNAIAILLGIELMLNAANVNLIAFAQYDPAIKGQIFSLFIIVVAAAEAAIGLALIIRMYGVVGHIRVDIFNKLKG